MVGVVTGGYLFALVQPDVFGGDGGVHLGLGALQLQEAVLLAVGAGPVALAAEHQLPLHPLLEGAHPAQAQD